MVETKTKKAAMGDGLSHSDYSADSAGITKQDIEEYAVWLREQAKERLKAEFPELYYELLEFEEEALREADGSNESSDESSYGNGGEYDG